MRSLNRTVLAFVMTLTVALAVGCNKQPAPESAQPAAVTSAAPVTMALPDFTALVKKEGPAVINISTVRKIRGHFPFPAFPELAPDDPFYEFFHRFMPGDQFPREFRSQSLGSGFIISTDGYILTNAHVVEDADEVTVRLTDQREFDAKVVGADRRSDIALLKISARNLPVVNIGDSSKLEVGEWVVAIGSPFGFTNSISQGIVSAKGRSLPGENIVPFIQTDVPVNPGNSGGPLFNLNGEVVGINSQIYSRSGGYMGLSFAIPINLAMKVKDELLKHGRVRRGWLGVMIQSVGPETAASFKLSKAHGALVSSVDKNGPAAQAGLAIGDIILQFNGKDLAGADELIRAVAETAPGARVKLRVWRNGAGKDITVHLGEAESERMAQKQPPQEKAAVPSQLGLVLRELTPDEQQALHTEGFLLVEEVAGLAADSGIQPGDIILAINSQRVSSIAQLQAALARVGNHAAVLVQREDETVYIPLKVPK